MPAREEVAFESHGARCAAWLYRPQGEGTHPCVVLAHGFSGVRDQRLDAYAERFAQAGLAALVFDYRHFGASEGEPRQLLSIARQLEDWRAAVGFARTLKGVDPQRIGLWGSSFSGGHVVQIAADLGGIRAVVSQVPFTDGLSALRAVGPLLTLELTLSGLRDALRGLRGRPPFLLPAVGPPGSRAAMTAPGAEAGFRGITPEGSGWRNAYSARVGLTLLPYRPYRRLARTGCPVLVQVAGEDSITPPGPALKAARAAPNAELSVLDGLDHFDIYLGEAFERVVGEQTAFLTRELAISPAPPEPLAQPPAPPSRAG